MSDDMRPCFHIEIVTPKKVRLQGLLFGPKRPRRVFVWMHGLGSNMFSKLRFVDALVDKDTAVLAFNNRGSGKVGSGSSGRNKRIRTGAAHEVFTDCMDDIDGAVRAARSTGAREIIIVGHSTGCQKSAYWAYKRGRGVRAIVLLAPVSDYASESEAQGERALKRAERVARRYVQGGQKHRLLPEEIWSWSWLCDAQRFLSLYTGKSIEEIFTYWDPARRARVLAGVRAPILVVLAERDEYARGWASRMAEWFDRNIRSRHRVTVVKNAPHSFKTHERIVAREIRKFLTA